MEITLSYLLDRCAAKFPWREGLVTEQGRWTFDQWRAGAVGRSAVLAGLGISKGDHVATLFPNGRDVLELFPALWRLGAVPVPLNLRLSPPELAYILDHCQAEFFVFDVAFADLVKAIETTTNSGTKHIVCGGEHPGAVCFDRAATETGPSDDDPPHASEDDPAVILFTAGTTGRPKGVVLSHKNCLFAAINLAQDSCFEPHFRVLLVFPLFHAAAFGLLTTCLYLGLTLVSMAKFDPRQVLEVMEREKISKMAFPPTVWNMILQLDGLENYDTGSVESISSGAAPMSLETKHRLTALFPRARLGETYGMTETAATITTVQPGETDDRTGYVGRPFTNVEVRVVNPDGSDVEPGEVGEVLVRGPSVMTGYHNDPQATARAIKHGWLYTGDLGMLDGDGLLCLKGRQADMIISGGENIYPREVEEVLFTHPEIVDAAVVGLPDPVWGERVHAVVAIRAGSSLTGDEVIEFCRTRLAQYKKPRTVSFMDRIPRSPAGKVQKRQLRHDLTRRSPEDGADIRPQKDSGAESF
jgi:acyl-CoA synthetase (AMP-forming)/AMP-acid ligase II